MLGNGSNWNKTLNNAEDGINMIENWCGANHVFLNTKFVLVLNNPHYQTLITLKYTILLVIE